MDRLSSTGSKILAFGSHCSANFQPILNCLIPKFKLKYDDLENIKTDRVNTVVFTLLQIRQSKFLFGTPSCANLTQRFTIFTNVQSINIRSLYEFVDILMIGVLKLVEKCKIC